MSPEFEAATGIRLVLVPWIILSTFFKKIYVQRGLIRNFVVRDLRARYIGSFMGFFWSVIHPIVLLVSYTFVFSIIFGVRPLPDSGTTSFPCSCSAASCPGFSSRTRCSVRARW